MRGMRGAVIVVNRDLNVTAWNHRAEDLWGLRADEVRHKNVFGLDIGLPVDQLRRALRSCLSGDEDVQEVTLPAVNRRGKSIECKVTCTPLKGQMQVDGAILMIEQQPAPHGLLS
jgi:two-component system CheB/CheR fusion protein